jgi:hypothetical protein
MVAGNVEQAFLTTLILSVCLVPLSQTLSFISIIPHTLNVVQFENLIAKVRDKSGQVSAVVGQEAVGQHNARSCFDQDTSCVVHPELLVGLCMHIYSYVSNYIRRNMNWISYLVD